jgi:ribosomal-protein-alanine N-acetyltransferase
MSVILRRASEGDLDGVMQLENITFMSDAWSMRTMRGELQSENCFYLVAVMCDGVTDSECADAGCIVGYAGLCAPVGAGHADIQTIAVSASARGQGLGRMLMQNLLEEAKQREVVEVFLEVRADNGVAQSLYSSLGFEGIAVRPRYYQPDNIDAIVMSLVVSELQGAAVVGNPYSGALDSAEGRVSL